MADEFKPGFFSDSEYAFVTAMAGTLLPKDDYPSAVEVGVPQMMDKMVGEVYAIKDRDNFRAGLKALMEKMDGDNEGGFANLDSAAALAYLQQQDELFKKEPVKMTMSGEDVPKAEMAEGEGPSARNAYFSLKSSIIGNYFQTEEIATTLLAYLPVPGEYIPCGDLQELTGGKAWAI